MTKGPPSARFVNPLYPVFYSFLGVIVPLLIDGHNLIGSGALADISLDDEDDEAKLVARLRVWRSKAKDQMTVVFDHGITGGKSIALSGVVT